MALIAAVAMSGTSFAQTTIEDFESTTWPSSGWVAASGSGGATSTAAAHDGARGWIGTGGWYRETTTTIGDPGDILSAWSRRGTTSTGRTYFGFADNGAGCHSLVLGSNTSNIIIQRNSGYGYADLTSQGLTVATGVWHRLEVEFGAAGDVTGRAYASDGTTVLATVNVNIGTTTGNVALRSFGNHHTDTIQDITPSGGGGGGGAEVPASSTTSLLITAGLLGAALAIFLRKGQ